MILGMKRDLRPSGQIDVADQGLGVQQKSSCKEDMAIYPWIWLPVILPERDIKISGWKAGAILSAGSRTLRSNALIYGHLNPLCSWMGASRPRIESISPNVHCLELIQIINLLVLLCRCHIWSMWYVLMP